MTSPGNPRHPTIRCVCHQKRTKPRLRRVTELDERDCACGGLVIAVHHDTEDQARATGLHVQSLKHRQWVWESVGPAGDRVA